MSDPWAEFRQAPSGGDPWAEFRQGGAKSPADMTDLERQVAGLPPKDTAVQRFGHGLADPIQGGAQLVSHIIPGTKWLDAANNWLADQGLPLSRIPEVSDADRAKGVTGEDIIQQKREADIQTRAPKGFDWARLAGNIASPVNAAIPGGPIIAGAAGGGLQPISTPGDFWNQKGVQVLEGGLFGGAMKGGTKLLGAGTRAVSAMLTREFPDSTITAATEKILKRMASDEKAGGPTAQEAIDLVNEAAKSGKPMTLVDVGGKNVRSLLGNVYRQPGDSRALVAKFLADRDRQAAARLTTDIDKYVHGGRSATLTAEGLLRGRSAAAKPLWERALALQNIWSPRLQQFLNDPSLRGGMKRGFEIERLESVAEGRPFDPTQMGIDLDAEGNILIRRTPNMRVLHMAKTGLDAMIADERNEITGRLSSRGVALDKVRRAYLKEIEALDTSGAYKAARESWEGYSSSFDAIKSGRSIFQRNPDEIAAEFNALSDNGKEFYRLGVADTIRERLAKTGFTGDDAKSIIKNPWTRDQLRPIFRSDADFNKFVDAVTSESRMWGTANETLRNSLTAERVAEDFGDDTVALGTARIGEHALSGRWFGAIHAAYKLFKDVGLKPNPKLNEAIARILLTTPIDEGSDVGKRLLGQVKPEPRGGDRASRIIERSASPLALTGGVLLGERHPLYGGQ